MEHLQLFLTVTYFYINLRKKMATIKLYEIKNKYVAFFLKLKIQNRTKDVAACSSNYVAHYRHRTVYGSDLEIGKCCWRCNRAIFD